jgi:hypothetical protein
MARAIGSRLPGKMVGALSSGAFLILARATTPRGAERLGRRRNPRVGKGATDGAKDRQAFAWPPHFKMPRRALICATAPRAIARRNAKASASHGGGGNLRPS